MKQKARPKRAFCFILYKSELCGYGILHKQFICVKLLHFLYVFVII